MLTMIIDAFKAVADWVLSVVAYLFMGLIETFMPSVEIDWSPFTAYFAIANTFAPVSEFFLFLGGYYVIKGSVWLVKCAIQLL